MIRIDLSKVSAAPSTPALQRQRRTAEKARSTQARRRRQQLEEEIARAVEEAGISPTVHSKVHQDVNKIGHHLTSSRKERMGGMVEEEQDRRQDLGEVKRTERRDTTTTPSRRSSYSSGDTRAGRVSPASYAYETPVKSYRHYPIVSSASRLQPTSTTGHSEQKRRTAEKQRRIDAHARLDSMKQEIYRQVNPEDVATPSLIAHDIDHGLRGVEARLNQGRARSTIPGNGDIDEYGKRNRKGTTSVGGGSSTDAPSTKNRTVEGASLSRSSSLNPTAMAAKEQRKKATSTHRSDTSCVPEQPWYMAHRLRLLVLVVMVACGGLFFPPWQGQRQLPLATNDNVATATQPIAVVVEKTSVATKTSVHSDDFEKPIAVVVHPDTTSRLMLVVMFVATSVWLYAAYRVLQKRFLKKGE